MANLLVKHCMIPLGRTWLRWRSYAVLADRMKRGGSAWIVRWSRWGLFDDPQVASHVLLMAITHAEDQIVETLLDRGVDINRAYKGSTCLHWAMAAYSIAHPPSRRARALSIVREVLEHGADMQCPNRHGRSAWKEMEQRPQEVADLLRAEHVRRQGRTLDLATAPALQASAPARRL